MLQYIHKDFPEACWGLLKRTVLQLSVNLITTLAQGWDVTVKLGVWLWLCQHAATEPQLKHTLATPRNLVCVLPVCILPSSAAHGPNSGRQAAVFVHPKPNKAPVRALIVHLIICSCHYTPQHCLLPMHKLLHLITLLH